MVFKTMLSSIVAKNMKKKLDNWTIKEEDVTEVLKQIRISLLDADVNLLVVKDLIKKIRQKVVGAIIEQGNDPQKFLLTVIKDELVNILGKEQVGLKMNKSPLKIMMVGLQGSGKTTTCAKIANLLKTKNSKKPLLVGLDIYRPAAIEQLRTLSKEVQVDFFEKGTKQKPAITAKEALHHAQDQKEDLIIFDTAGRLQTNIELMEELVSIKKAVSPDEIILVVDAQAGQDILNVAKEFNDYLNLTGIIITKVDSNARLGAALSLTYMLNVPIKFTGTGEKVGSIDIFYPNRTADQILGLGDVLTLAEKAAENIDESRAKRSIAKMMAGKMDLEDLLWQMEQVKKMGSLGSIVKMLPNMGKFNVSDDKIESAETKMRIWRVLMDSMTLKERKNPNLFKKQPSRKTRVVKGSGRKPDELNKLLSEWSKAKQKMEEVGKSLKKGKNPFASFGRGF